MKTIVVEDEQHAREHLCQLLRHHFPWLELCGAAGNVTDAKALIVQHQPALLLLDIRLGNATAFDLLDALGQFSCQVIFITAYNEYAIRAFRIAAVDYLLKPLQTAELTEALYRAKERYEGAMGKPMLQELSAIVRELQQQQRMITLADRQEYVRVSVSEIEYCFSSNGCVQVHFVQQEKLVVAKELRELEMLLEPSGFIRCHQSYLVNERRVRSIKREEGRTYLILVDGIRIPVSRSSTSWVRMRLGL